MALENLMVFTGNANPELALGVAKHLGIPLGKAVVSKFSDGDIVVEINDNVRVTDVVLRPPTRAPPQAHLRANLLKVHGFHSAAGIRYQPPHPATGVFSAWKAKSGRLPVGVLFVRSAVCRLAGRLGEMAVVVEAEEGLGLPGGWVRAWKVVETEPKSHGETRMWIDHDGAFVRLKVLSTEYRRAANQAAAELVTAGGAPFPITAMASPTIPPPSRPDRLLRRLRPPRPPALTGPGFARTLPGRGAAEYFGPCFRRLRVAHQCQAGGRDQCGWMEEWPVCLYGPAFRPRRGRATCGPKEKRTLIRPLPPGE